MSRRRFGDADDTYKDFISAINDHDTKRKQRQRAEQAAAAAAQAEAQRAQPSPPPPGAAATSINYQGGSALHSAYFDDLRASDRSALSLNSPHLRAADIAELPIGAVEKDSGYARDFSLQRRPSLGIGLGGASTGTSSRRLNTTLRTGAGGYEEEPLLGQDRSTSAMSEAAAAEQHVLLTKRNLDLVIQRKSIWIFVNGMFGVLLMCVIQEICWSPTWQMKRYNEDVSVPADYYSDIEWVSHRLALHPDPLPHTWSWSAVAGECPSPARSIVTEAVKILLTLSTLLLCWQIMDRKKLQVNIKFREQRRKLKAKAVGGANQEQRDKVFINGLNSVASNISTLGLLSLHRNQFRLDIWSSLLVCLIQPIPFTHQLTLGYIDDKIGLLMWMRIFLGFRVIRDCSEIWLTRRSIKHQSSFETKVPDFDWWLSCKTICYRRPLFFSGCFYVMCILIFGHCLYLSERQRLPTYFTISSSLFCSFQMVSIGWPADVWEIYMPITFLGKMVSMFAAMAGLILISFVIVTVGSALYPSKFEENALNYIAMDKVRQREREGSAALIQFVWKNAQREAELEAKLQPKNPGLYEEISEMEEKAFMESFIQRSKELRTIRRERAELEERSDPTSERNISPMDAYFDTKIEALRTDILHQTARNQQQFMNILATLNQLVHKQKEMMAGGKGGKGATAAAGGAGAGASGPPTATGGGRKQRASLPGGQAGAQAQQQQQQQQSQQQPASQGGVPQAQQGLQQVLEKELGSDVSSSLQHAPSAPSTSASALRVSGSMESLRSSAASEMESIMQQQQQEERERESSPANDLSSEAADDHRFRGAILDTMRAGDLDGRGASSGEQEYAAGYASSGPSPVGSQLGTRENDRDVPSEDDGRSQRR